MCYVDARASSLTKRLTIEIWFVRACESISHKVVHGLKVVLGYLGPPPTRDGLFSLGGRERVLVRRGLLKLVTLLTRKTR